MHPYPRDSPEKWIVSIFAYHNTIFLAQDGLVYLPSIVKMREHIRHIASLFYEVGLKVQLISSLQVVKAMCLSAPFQLVAV